MVIELTKIPLVDISNNGVFKYVLIKVQEKDEGNGEEPNIIIVRGYQRNWHIDIFEEVQNTLSPLKCACLGGGKMIHKRAEKKILVYGESTGYGRADHEITSNILKDFYKDYTVTVGNE